MDKLALQDAAFAIISGLAQPKYQVLGALRQWRLKTLDDAAFFAVLKEAEKALGEAGKHHLSLIAAEASGLDLPHSLILMHAEDQYLTLQLLIEVLLIWLQP